MKTLVAGIGAVGGWVLARLTEGGADVEGWARGETLARLASGEPLTVESQQHPWSGPVRVVDAPAGPYDLVIVCAKSTDTAVMGAGLAVGPVVLSAQNGLDNPDVLRQWHPRVEPAAVYVGAERTGPVTVWHRSAGFFQVGDEALAQFLTAHNLPAHHEPDMVTAMWRKLMSNAVINSVAAITRQGGGSSLAGEEMFAIARRAAEEVRRVAVADGAMIDADVVDKLTTGLRSLPDHTRPSTLQDLLAGRALEYDAITGAVLRRAKRHGVPAPTIEVFDALLRAIDPGRTVSGGTP